MLLRRIDGGEFVAGRLSPGDGQGPDAMALLVSWDGRAFSPLDPDEAAVDYELVRATAEERELLARGPFRDLRVREGE